MKKINKHYKNTIEDVWNKVNKKSNEECWEWTGCKNQKGYGRFKINNKLYSAHRLIYELSHGSISKGLCVLHHCDNPSCCNPNHLWLGTQLDNSNDKINKGRESHLQQFGEKNPNKKLTEDQVKEIRKLYSTGNYTQKEIGDIFTTHQVNISYIVLNKTWND